MTSKKQSAFGGDWSYGDLAEIGKEIGSSHDQKALRKHLNTMSGEIIVDVQRSSAVISHAADINADLFLPFIPQLINILRHNVHRSASRTTFRILEKLENIPDQFLGILIEISFDYLNGSGTSIAEKVFTMTFIANQLNRFPDLKGELEASISTQMQTASAGFNSRARKLARQYHLQL